MGPYERIDGSELNQLADDLDRLGIPVVAGFSTHPTGPPALASPVRRRAALGDPSASSPSAITLDRLLYGCNDLCRYRTNPQRVCPTSSRADPARALSVVSGSTEAGDVVLGDGVRVVVVLRLFAGIA
jgi:hypothetical protein